MLPDFQSQLLVLSAALAVDRIAGDPGWLWGRIPHPVVLFGKAIGLADTRLNGEGLQAASLRLRGLLTIVFLLGAAVSIGVGIALGLDRINAVGIVVETVIVAVLLAQKSLADHVAAVARALSAEGLESGRRAVSLIVGRDPAALDEPGISRAAIESLAENFSDGVVAPAFWYALFGLPGLLAYKMLNTADSMIGHRTRKYADFGRAAAKADDWANWPAARLSAFLIVLGATFAKGHQAGKRALSGALREHGLHRSPNAGWPEAAMAGALDVGLAGPRIYQGEMVAEPMLNSAAAFEADAGFIDRALAIYSAACTFLLLGVALAGLVTMCA